MRRVTSLSSRGENGSLVVLEENRRQRGPESDQEYLSPEQGARILFDMGFRLSASLDIQIKDTYNSIELTNVHAPVLCHVWADGMDSRPEGFYRLLDVPVQDDYAEETLADWLYMLTEEAKGKEVDPRGAENLIGTRDENSFLVSQRIREAWGNITCYVALAEAGGDPWEWIPPEMVRAVCEELRDYERHGVPLPADSYINWFLPHPEIAAALIFSMVKQAPIYERVDWRDPEKKYIDVVKEIPWGGQRVD